MFGKTLNSNDDNMEPCVHLIIIQESKRVTIGIVVRKDCFLPLKARVNDFQSFHMEPQKYSTLQLTALIRMQSIALERSNRTAPIILLAYS